MNAPMIEPNIQAPTDAQPAHPLHEDASQKRAENSLLENSEKEIRAAQLEAERLSIVSGHALD